MERYFEINEQGHNIRCKLYFNKQQEIHSVIIFCHGFAGHKDNKAAQKFAEKILTKFKNKAVVVFDWPCHGDDVKKKLTLNDCEIYLRLVIDYVNSAYEADELYAYATSFGAYMVLKYIFAKGNPFKKIALRCPAVNLYDSFYNVIMQPEEKELLNRGKNASVGFDRKIEINPQFLQDIQEEDVRKMDFLDYADDILILHGTKDEVIPFSEAEKFSDDNVIELVAVENADHRFQNPKSMEIATKAVIDFFGF